MSQARALAEAQRLAAIMARHGVRCSIEVQPGVAGSGWYSTTPRVAAMGHHTVARRTQGATPCLAIVKRGRPDVPGPLSNGYMGFDEIYRIITLGWANHPGAGGPLTVAGRTIPRNNARPYVWGTEYEGGLDPDDFTPSYRAAMARANAAILAWLGLPIEAHIEHSTWAPGRKVDRLGYTAATGQAEIRAALASLPPTTQETLMSGPVRIRRESGAITLVDLSTGAFVGVPNTEYDAALAKVDVPSAAVSQREYDILAEFTTRIRTQLRAEVWAHVTTPGGPYTTATTMVGVLADIGTHARKAATDAGGATEVDVAALAERLAPALAAAVGDRATLTPEQVQAAAEAAVRGVLRDGVGGTQ